MRYALLGVMAAGIVIGLALPVAPPRPVRAVAAVPARPAAAPAPERRQADPPRETILERGANGHFVAFADVNDEPVRFVVDTGATVVALTMDDARRAGVAFDPGQFTEVGQGASGPLHGQEVVLNAVTLDGKRMEDVHALVLDGLGVSLLGQNYLRRLDTVSIAGDTMTLR